MNIKPQDVSGIRLLSLQEASERCGGLSHWTWREWIARGLVKSVILGGRRLIPSTEIDRIIADALAGRGPLSRHGRGKAAKSARKARTTNAE